MSDTDLRALERQWRTGGNPADGEAWAAAELRANGVPMLTMIAMLIQQGRAIRALATPAASWHTARHHLRTSVTPDDIVAFLRGQQDSSPTPADPNDTLPSRPVEPGHWMLCEHANEVPRVCPCEPVCYCQRPGGPCWATVQLTREEMCSEPRCDYTAIVSARHRSVYACGQHIGWLNEQLARPE